MQRPLLSPSCWRWLVPGMLLGLLCITATARLAHAQDSIQTVDTGSVGIFTSLALDSDGFPVISYYDSVNSALKLARCGDATCTSASLVTVDSAGAAGSFNSLALDDHGFPVVSYHHFTDGLKLARCTDATCTSKTVVTVDGSDIVGTYTSLQLDAHGFPVISYADSANGALKLAHCTDANCTGRTIVTVDSGALGAASSLALDVQGFPVISYFDLVRGALKLAHCTDADCTGRTTVTVDSSTVGGFAGFDTSLALDANGNPVISYFDLATGDLRLAHCTDASCTGSMIVTVDSGTVDRITGWFTSLVLDDDGSPVIGYYDAANGALKLARCDSADCTGGTSIATVDSNGDVGMHTSLVLDGQGFPVISYYDADNRALKLAHCDDPYCARPPNLPPVARCQDVTVAADGACQASVTAAQVNSGSTDPDADPLSFFLDASGPFGPGSHEVTLTVSDGEETDVCAATVTVVDQTLPTIACPADQRLPLTSSDGAVATFSATAGDNCGAVASTCAPISGSLFPIGLTPITCSVTDGAGLQRSCDFTVQVTYPFDGFFAPVNNPPKLNQIKAGQAVPLKFSLGGDYGLDIMAPGAPSSRPTTCDSGAPVGTIDETMTAGGSSLTYEASTDQYIYVWKTLKSWAGSCRELQVTLTDGSMHTATFQFK